MKQMMINRFYKKVISLGLESYSCIYEQVKTAIGESCLFSAEEKIRLIEGAQKNSPDELKKIYEKLIRAKEIEKEFEETKRSTAGRQGSADNKRSPLLD